MRATQPTACQVCGGQQGSVSLRDAGGPPPRVKLLILLKARAHCVILGFSQGAEGVNSSEGLRGGSQNRERGGSQEALLAPGPALPTPAPHPWHFQPSPSELARSRTISQGSWPRSSHSGQGRSGPPSRPAPGGTEGWVTEQGPQNSRLTTSPACLLLLLSSSTSPGAPPSTPWSRYPPCNHSSPEGDQLSFGCPLPSGRHSRVSTNLTLGSQRRRAEN